MFDPKKCDHVSMTEAQEREKRNPVTLAARAASIAFVTMAEAGQIDDVTKRTGRPRRPRPCGRRSATRQRNGRTGPSPSAHMTPIPLATRSATAGNAGSATSTGTSGNLASTAGPKSSKNNEMKGGGSPALPLYRRKRT